MSQIEARDQITEDIIMSQKIAQVIHMLQRTLSSSDVTINLESDVFK